MRDAWGGATGTSLLAACTVDRGYEKARKEQLRALTVCGLTPLILRTTLSVLWYSHGHQRAYSRQPAVCAGGTAPPDPNAEAVFGRSPRQRRQRRSTGAVGAVDTHVERSGAPRDRGRRGAVPASFRQHGQRHEEGCRECGVSRSGRMWRVRCSVCQARCMRSIVSRRLRGRRGSGRLVLAIDLEGELRASTSTAL